MCRVLCYLIQKLTENLQQIAFNIQQTDERLICQTCTRLDQKILCSLRFRLFSFIYLLRRSFLLFFHAVSLIIVCCSWNGRKNQDLEYFHTPLLSLPLHSFTPKSCIHQSILAIHAFTSSDLRFNLWHRIIFDSNFLSDQHLMIMMMPHNLLFSVGFPSLP